MHRCLELALLGAGHTAPNPMVGAVLVYEDPDAGKDGAIGEGRIIGEGYHRQYGQAHAEVNCIAAVREEDRPLIAASTLYVSLEPCAHFGKTPPCADLIIEKKIPRVVVGCRDPFPQVNGKGIEKLVAAGVEVTVGVLEKECIALNRRFFTFNTRHRPYIVLKWAQSADGKIAAGASGAGAGAGASGARTLISNDYTNRLVHKWRSEEAAILVGTRTALADDPALTARLWNGPDPIRLVIDKELRLPSSLQLFDRKVRTVVFNTLRHEEEDNLQYYQLATDSSLVHQLTLALYQLKIQSVLVEGGARLLQSFIDEDYWDEARVITNNDLEIPGGLAAPVWKEARLVSRETLLSDAIRYYDRHARNSN
jgi:diaminohydroxyphosphoribosylaminopyrimidine deaminase/5-amino-6-(5-phosphoribosylamino)uracil reductase